MTNGLLVHLFQHNRQLNQLHFAIKMGDIDYIKALLANGVDLYEFDSVCSYLIIYTVLPQVMAWAFISFQQLFNPATKQDR